jgi:uncharacterized protein (TIGR02246 family)
VTRTSKLAAILMFVLLAPASAALADLRGELEAAARAWEERFAASDAAGLAALYAEDAQLLPPQSEPVNGRAAIEKYWRSGMDQGAGEVKFEIFEVHAMGDLAADVGRFVFRDATGTEVDRGLYIVLWKKVGGEWRLFRDIWNSSVVPAAAPAP